MSFKCLKCGRVLYNRRRGACELCGAVIPEGHRLSPRAQGMLDRMRADERRSHREFMSRGLGGEAASLGATAEGFGIVADAAGGLADGGSF
jgi:hypothetical protein